MVKRSKLTPQQAVDRMAEIKKEKQDVKKKIHIEYVSQKDMLKHQSWCFNNDVIIYPIQISVDECRIMVIDKGFKELSSHVYRTKKLRKTDEKWEDIIWRLYSKYYFKYNKNE